MTNGDTLLTLSPRDDGFQVTQVSVSPTVYLDQWALADISEDKELMARFTAALEAANGTLALSWAHLAEFSKVSTPQSREAEEFIDAILPRVFFLEADPFVVIERENILLAGGPHVPPHADQDFLRAFTFLKKPNSLKILTAHDLFSAVQGKLTDETDRLGDVFVDRLKAMRDEVETKPELRVALSRPASGPPIERGTRFILRELGRALLLDKQTKITRNHAMDFFHSVVSVSYCDLVLVDKYWEQQARLVRSRFEQAKMPVPMAKVFSKKSISSFFQSIA